MKNNPHPPQLIIRLFLLVCFGLIGYLPIVAQEQAEPQPGEGIRAFLQRNNRPGEKAYQQFLELNKGRIGEDQGLKLGFRYLLPSIEGTTSSVAEPTKATIPTTSSPGKATPLRGEGTKAFLIRNNCSGNEKYQQFLGLNKDKLGPDNTLQLGVEYTLPTAVVVREESIPKKTEKKESNNKESASITLTEPLFGKKYSKYPVLSERMKGACFYLVSAAGGADCGSFAKISTMDLYEDEYAYDIMLRLALLLKKQSATVHIIIQDAQDGIRDDKYLHGNSAETCMGTTIPPNPAQSLKQRVDKINSLNRESVHNYRRTVSIHLDGRNEKQEAEMNFYYVDGSKTSESLANALHKASSMGYKAKYPGKKHHATTSVRNTYLLNNVATPAVMAVLGNIQNESDQQLLLDGQYRQAVAEWICQGLLADFEEKR